MGRRRRPLGELGTVQYTVDSRDFFVARGRVYDGGGKEHRPSGSGPTREEALTELEARLGERAAPSASSAGADLDAFAPPAPPEPPAPAAGTGPPGPLDAPLDAPAQADPEQSQP